MCADCQHKTGGVCSTLNCRIFSGSIDSEVIIDHLNELRSRNYIDQLKYNQCKAMSGKQPLDALRQALIPTSTIAPDESEEIRSLYRGSEMVVEIDPRYVYETQSLNNIDPRVGRDNFLA